MNKPSRVRRQTTWSKSLLLMRFTTHPDVYLEVLTVKLAQLDGQAAVQPVAAATVNPEDPTVHKLAQQVEQLQSEVKTLRSQGGSVTKPAPAKPRSSNGPVVKKVNVSQIYPILGAATKNDLIKVRDVWTDLMNILSVTQRALMHVAQPYSINRPLKWSIVWQWARMINNLKHLPSKSMLKSCIKWSRR
ncbi:hypothetical protein WP50_35000 [Lactiplantibacillus plantarum]|nr:hypothetical protein WP50_35000 [Lactiplantibacillus plantarum]